MPKYVITTPYLDEMGSVYIPCIAGNGGVVRLNAKATDVWRGIAASGTHDPGPDGGGGEFITWLLAAGAIQTAPAEGELA